MDRTEFFTTIADRLTNDELQYVQRAYWLVKEVHRTQFRRLSGERYFEHVRRVAFTAAHDYGYYDGQTIALGLLHDTIEDTFVPMNILVNLFGKQMYELVLTLSKEIPTFHNVTGKLIGRVKLSTEDYYKNLKNGHKKSKIIKGCDRIDNLSDLAQWDAQRQRKYINETNDYVLPAIYSVDVRITQEIQKRITI